MTFIPSLDEFELTEEERMNVEALFTIIPEIVYEMVEHYDLMESYESRFDGNFKVKVNFKRNLTEEEIEDFRMTYNITAENGNNFTAKIAEIEIKTKKSIEFSISID